MPSIAPPRLIFPTLSTNSTQHCRTSFVPTTAQTLSSIIYHGQTQSSMQVRSHHLAEGCEAVPGNKERSAKIRTQRRKNRTQDRWHEAPHTSVHNNGSGDRRRTLLHMLLQATVRAAQDDLGVCSRGPSHRNLPCSASCKLLLTEGCLTDASSELQGYQSCSRAFEYPTQRQASSGQQEVR